VIIPAKLRAGLTERFWLMLDADDNVSLYNYQTGLDILQHCERQIAEHPGNEDIAAAVERITGAAEEVNVEGGWRVQVPDILRFHAQLDKDIVIVGVINRAVMWSRERWEKAQAQRLQSAEVRRAQAEILRAAASSINSSMKKPDIPMETAEPVEQDDVAAIATGTRGVIGAGGKPQPAAAPASDGKRGSRVLTLSQLGR
jgi:MraZ protein